MKIMNKFLLLVAVFYVCVAVWPVIGAEAETEDAATQEQEEESVVPDSTDMTLGMKENPYVLPEDFRGGDPDSELVNCLEDVYYEKHEHSLIYNPEASALAEDAEFESDPNITWETRRINEDGTEEVLESNNSNMAADGGTFFAPGQYQVGNHGARQVAEGDAGATDTEDEEGDDGEGAEGDNTDDVALVDD
ncbi:MAG: hypothetical protein ACQETH_03725, partial [Candidatus Rifleibacteriota bacterium]